MIAMIAIGWLCFLLGFLFHAVIFPKVERVDICPLCRERWESQLDKWA